MRFHFLKYIMLIISFHVFRTPLYYLKMAMLAETYCKTH